MIGTQTVTDSQAWQPGYVFLDVQDPLIAWLVYRAELVSALLAHERALSVWCTGRLRDIQVYQHEMSLEQVRRASFPDAVSRLTGFYAFPDRQAALAAASRWQVPSFREDLLAEVGIHPAATVSRYDAEWITHHFGSPDSQWMNDYFAGKPTTDPIWELLIDGRALVFGKSLREAAYETVKATWPRSLALLELARVGAELNSDLGLITAMLFTDGTGLDVRYAMNFVERQEPGLPQTLRRVRGTQEHKRPDARFRSGPTRPH